MKSIDFYALIFHKISKPDAIPPELYQYDFISTLDAGSGLQV